MLMDLIIGIWDGESDPSGRKSRVSSTTMGMGLRLKLMV